MPPVRPAVLPLVRALCGASLLCAGLSQAQTPASQITQVTVYPGSATVERLARVPAGARSVTFRCLPATLDVQSLQVNADPALRVGEFNVLTEERELATGCSSPVEGRIRELEDQLAGVQAEVGALQLVDSYLKRVAGGPSDDEAAPPRAPTASPAASQIGATAETLRRTGQDTASRAHALKRRQESIERALKPLLAERDRVAGQRTHVVSVTVTLATEREADLRLSYQLRGPGWQPSYRATLDAGRASVRLERLALVAQNSGEDWSNVQLTLSTGQPNRATQGRLPRPWSLDVAPPPSPRPVMMEKAARARAPAPVAMANAAPQEDLPSFEVSTVDKGFATEFAVPQRITVPSSGQRVTLALGAHSTPATLLTRTAPGVDETAFLVAQIAPPPGVWPAGPVNLYRDGAFVGTGRLDFGGTTAGAATPSLSFGRDELVLVRAEPPQDVTGTTGLTGAHTERRTVRRYQVENRHKTPVTLQLLHAAPVSRHTSIEVESRYQPQPTTLAWQGTPGTIAWQQPLAAGASGQFSAEHTIRHPKDIELEERQ